MRKAAKGRSYPVVAWLEYQSWGDAPAGANAACEAGTGRTLVISSGTVLFEADRPLPAGLTVSLSIAWPVSLSKSVGLTLRVSGRILHARRKVAALAMTRYEFHTRSLSANPRFATAAGENRAIASAAG
jgi:hypothetical protein